MRTDAAALCTVGADRRFGGACPLPQGGHQARADARSRCCLEASVLHTCRKSGRFSMAWR